MKKTTIADVARLANVSKSTISQYLNKRYDHMSEETRKKIEEAIRELNYYPNILARSLKQKTTYTIGVVVANILHVFSTNVIRCIEDFFHEHGFHVIVCNADDEPEKERRYIEMLRAKQVDGIIIFPTGGNIDLYEQMLDEQYPVVFMDRTIENLEIETILLDNKRAAQLAVNHFVEQGYERIAIVTTSILRKITPRIERIQGYKEALEYNGIEVNPNYIKSVDSESLADALDELFQYKPSPQAILAGNDIVLMATLKFIHQRNLKIPDDVAVIGIDHVPFAEFYIPPITIVAQPAREMAQEASRRLLQRIKREETARQEPLIKRFAPTLIVGSSSIRPL
ncbi:putative HTH-type transcriptional regulator EndR [Geobacillus sp. PA-3]|uniref:LacI family DNA-binding transcriptional regulator n=1 Tax=Geobacillus sp. PA-3 TaxID=1699078 RepID=UPI0006E6719B|nr:substrate-binding domain-containing protein [Geobacillus sp. PA-3]KQB91631.1 putative HTH-type transcriptional regulator EndR [Geobacillus sp. PA-3]